MERQRLGLALSGGGFRASFFHIGILARMAELNLLRDVESISTVSGGSIIGAHYYLHLKNLLESKSDADITQQEYLDLVAKVEKEFLNTVQLNLRMRTFSSIWHNMKMALPNYSRSDRIGELYDKYLYRPIAGKKTSECIWVSDLKIHPVDDVNAQTFNPTKGHNESRINKVPIININATVLNTGHNWRFTAVDMGEVVHEDPLALKIDKNTRLLKDRYEDICGRDKGGFHLGHAVAASAGVPGIFPPLSISNMYNWSVQLVDGGIYDNQGIEALHNGAIPCSHIIISDASGQMRDEHEPDTGTVPVFMRTTDILMGRVREEMIASVNKDSKRNISLIHLKEGLDVLHKLPRDKTCPKQIEPESKNDIYGKLSRIRTDLDSFSDIEATCLMARGYTLAQIHIDEFCRQWNPEIGESQTGSWFFNQAIPWLTHPEQGPATLHKQLSVAEQKFGKSLRLGISLDIILAILAFIIGITSYLAAIYFAIEYINPELFSNVVTWLQNTTVMELIYMLLIIALGYCFEKIGKAFKLLKYFRQPYRLISTAILRLAFPALSAIPIKIYLATLDKYYVRQGKLK